MASIKGKGILYKNQYGWSISQTIKDQHGKSLVFYIPVRFIKYALSRVEDRKLIEFEGFTNHYKSKDGKTMTEYVITHIQESQSKPSVDIGNYQASGNHHINDQVSENDTPLIDISSDDLPFWKELN